MTIEQSKIVLDSLSIGTVLGTLIGILPAIAAFFTIIWTMIRIYETKTIQSFIKRIRNG